MKLKKESLSSPLTIEQTDNAFKIAGLSVLIVIGTVLVFWKTLTYPYVQDDWFHLYGVAHENVLTVIKNAFSPFEKLHYRPFNTLFFLFSYKLLGLNAIGYHLIALSIHCCNALLTVYIIQEIEGSPLTAWCAGMLYGTAVTVHMEPLIWGVGIQALGCALFFYISIALFLRHHAILSSLSFLLSLLFQEGSLFLPSIIFCYVILHHEGTSLTHTPRKIVENMWPFCLVLGFYFVLKIQGSGYFGAPESSPYKAELLGPHVLRNCIFYFAWAVETILPWKDIPFGTRLPHAWKMEFPQLSQTAIIILIIAVIIAIAVIVYVITSMWTTSVSKRSKLFILWCTWLMGSIGAPLFFPNQIYRYYLTFASLPFIVLFLTCLKRIAHFLGVKERYGAAVIICYTVLITISSAFYFYTWDSEGINHGYRGGFNNLIKKGNIVRRTWEGLLKAHPTLPRNAVLSFEEPDTLWAFGFVDGPRLWYEDEELMVVYEKILKSDPRGIYIDDPDWIRAAPVDTGIKTSGRIYLDPDKTFVFSFRRGFLHEHELHHSYSSENSQM